MKNRIFLMHLGFLLIIIAACKKPEILGCTETNALNWNYSATHNDNACVFIESYLGKYKVNDTISYASPPFTTSSTLRIIEVKRYQLSYNKIIVEEISNGQVYSVQIGKASYNNYSPSSLPREEYGTIIFRDSTIVYSTKYSFSLTGINVTRYGRGIKL